MKQSVRAQILRLPVVGYMARLVVNAFRLPKTNDAFKAELHEQQAHLQALSDERVQLQKDIQETRAIAESKQQRMDTIETNLRLADSRIADLMHTAASHKTAAKTPKSSPAASTTGSTLLADDHTLDQFYIEFENKFRGSEEDIKKRLEVYLPYFEAAKKTPKHPVLDVGCGRGEFLQLIKEHGIAGKGLDLNESMVKRAQEQGLDVIQADAMQYLHDQPSGSVYAVTGFHLVEHIPFAALLRLMDECYRAIQPGGYAIFETPNPENMVVGSLNFYHDPSHLNPIPPALLQFVMETRGFSNVEIKRLHPMESNLETEDPLVRRMAERMFGPSDYAVIAQK